jgi:hypothetical protein
VLARKSACGFSPFVSRGCEIGVFWLRDGFSRGAGPHVAHRFSPSWERHLTLFGSTVGLPGGFLPLAGLFPPGTTVLDEPSVFIHLLFIM